MKTACVLAVLATIVVAGSFDRVRGQGGELAAAKLNHIGVVVPDIDKALVEYTRVMGFAAPKVNTYPLPLPDGKSAQIKVTTLTMPNFAIEVSQPVTQAGPFYDHLQKHGASIQHLGFVVEGPGNIDGVRAALEQNGGVWTLGPKGGNFAYVDFGPTLGTTIEINRGGPGAGATAPAPAADALPALGGLSATHVGFAAADTAAMTGHFAKVLGIAAPKVNEYKDSQYPPNSAWSPTAFLRLTSWRQGTIGIEAIQSVGGPTPWSEDVAKHKGTIAQHLAINVGNNMDEQIKDLMSKGGKWTNGKPGGGYAYLDFSNTLGLIFELNGSSKSAAPAK